MVGSTRTASNADGRFRVVDGLRGAGPRAASEPALLFPWDDEPSFEAEAPVELGAPAPAAAPSIGLVVGAMGGGVLLGAAVVLLGLGAAAALGAAWLSRAAAEPAEVAAPQVVGVPMILVVPVPTAEPAAEPRAAATPARSPARASIPAPKKSPSTTPEAPVALASAPVVWWTTPVATPPDAPAATGEPQCYAEDGGRFVPAPCR